MPSEIAVPLITFVVAAYAVHFAIAYLERCWYNDPVEKVELSEAPKIIN
jgi:hypothetical protein